MQIEDINRLRQTEAISELFEIELEQQRLFKELTKRIESKLTTPSIKTNQLLSQLIDMVKNN